MKQIKFWEVLIEDDKHLRTYVYPNLLLVTVEKEIIPEGIVMKTFFKKITDFVFYFEEMENFYQMTFCEIGAGNVSRKLEETYIWEFIWNKLITTDKLMTYFPKYMAR